MKARVYVETSVFSYLAARPTRDVIMLANQRITRTWWNRRRNDFELTVSQLVIDEAAAGDKIAARRRLKFVKLFPLIEQSEETLELASALLDHGAIPLAARADALHVAIAVTGGAEYLLTWNCRHINNAAMRDIIEGVCKNAGYEPPSICTPAELLEPT